MALPPNRDLCQSHPSLARNCEFDVTNVGCSIQCSVDLIWCHFGVTGTVFPENIETKDMCGKIH
jgi:hypothetical protein